MLKRKSSHAGSWYSDDPKLLQSQLTSLIQKNTTTTQLDSSSSSIKALIVPHAGYSYSANTASFSYSKLNQNTFIKTIFILGPSHHYYLQGCALTQCSEYETPLGNLTVDTDLIKELFETGQFEYMTLDTDENEHSIEMQLPFISFMLKKNLNFKIVPILVGNLTSKNTNILANIFSKYMVDTESMFLISSDFCHWGSRFRYTYGIDDELPIYESIENLDRKAMELIESLCPEKFNSYLKKTKNTICGRNPILLLLETINFVNKNKKNQEKIKATGNKKHEINFKKDVDFKLNFLHYEQSSKVLKKSDSSVSYAAAQLDIIFLD